ncbi:CHAT domain-containing protein [Pleionea sp. CnH1-48]|uniref:CHAT domain-containing protein n=1 Tax=Pleionea sp. CnH1-48 TaxID=2954494 RepID=UPI002096D660|nr:CHAT domain-containing tetratricopeptide repeat protein [Pleionea sp. CnH1-48]MCO7224952.1 CHAT domain-containing protein [Pleionea sp. CnH1-48]
MRYQELLIVALLIIASLPQRGFASCSTINPSKNEYFIVKSSSSIASYVQIEGASKVKLDPIEGRNLPIVVLSPHTTKNISLCNKNKYSKEELSITIEDRYIPNKGDKEILSLINKAQYFWALSDQESKLSAIKALKSARMIDTSNNWLKEIRTILLASSLEQIFKYENALTVINDLENSHYYPHTFHLIKARLLLRQNTLEKSLLEINKSIKYMAEGPQRLKLSMAIANNFLAEIMLYKSKILKAKELLDKALILSGDDHQIKAHIYNNMSFYRYLSAKNDSMEMRPYHIRLAFKELNTAKHHAALANDDHVMAIIENNFGSFYERNHELRNALKSYSAAFEIATKENNRELLSLILKNLGQIHQHLGDLNSSQKELNNALKITKEASSFQAAIIKCILGTTYRLKGEVDNSRIHHEECNQDLKNLKNPTAGTQNNIINSYLELAEDYKLLGNTTKYEKNLSEVESRISLLTDNDVKTKYFLHKANESIDRNDFQSSRKYFNQALSSSKQARSQVLHIDVLSKIIELHKQKKHYWNNIFEIQELAIDMINDYHTHLDLERTSPAWSNKTHSIYKNLASLVLSSGSDDKASKLYYILENSRATSLRLRLATRQKNSSQNSRLDKISSLQEKIVTDSNGSQSLHTELYNEQSLNIYDSIRNKGKNSLPSILPLKESQAKLKPDQSILYYLLLEKHLYLFVLEKDREEILKISPSNKVIDKIKEFRVSTSSQNHQKPKLLLQELSELLLPKDVLTSLQKDLLIIPHEALHYVPFSALPISSKGNQPIINSKTITFIPSVSSYFYVKNKKVKFSKKLSIFSNPVFDKKNITLASSDHFRSWKSNLSPLPFSEVEMNNIVNIFGKENANTFSKESATRKNLYREEVRNSQILHIATHGYFNPESPEYSGIILSVINEKHEKISSFVTFTDIFSRPFNNELVVINGCDTAKGIERKGEGVVGLSRGFMAQGVDHVISTLWPVSDAASERFMTLFYKNLKKERSLPKALKITQNQFRKGIYSSPFYWAPYILTSTSPDNVID